MLDSFFIYDAIPANVEKGIYAPLLVLVSYVVASLGAYAGLTFAALMVAAKEHRSKDILHASGAFVLGSSIWSMHFIGMLAYKMDMVVNYDPFLTSVSMLISIAIAYAVFSVVRLERLTTGGLIINPSCWVLRFALCIILGWPQ